MASVKRLELHQIGQIDDAEVAVGDLTLLVGPQASGKSVFLQMFKLVLDQASIVRTLKRYGFSVNGDFTALLQLMFGEGMGGVWPEGGRVELDGRTVLPASLLDDSSSAKDSVFFIPAQRVLTLEQGRPKSFESYRPLDPFAVKQFSEQLRQLMDRGLGGASKQLFPQDGRMKKVLRDGLDAAIFHGAQVEEETDQLQKRIVIRAGGSKLPYMTWSAGQREFMPMMLGFYWLMPQAGASKRTAVDWVVIEEPEMGLHPQAIQTVLVICLELMHRGYRVLLSTHSPLLLEAAWAIGALQQRGAGPDLLLELFELGRGAALRDTFGTVLRDKTLRSYYFEADPRGRVTVRDISTLDPFSDDAAIADWGGLTSFSSRAAEVVARATADARDAV